MSDKLERDYFLVGCETLTPIERTMGRISASQALLSEDNTKVGAVIYRDGMLLSRGYNKLSKNVSTDTYFINEDNKNDYILHAEMDAITSAAMSGNALMESTIIITGKCPCCDCAKAIINSGIIRVICPIPDKNSRWSKTNTEALRLLKSAGVEVVEVEELSGTKIGLTCPSKYIV